MSTSLKKQTISGMIWSAFQRFGSMGISFITNILLARLLTPEDYGCIGLLTIFITISNTFIDGGFGSALIQKKEPTQKDYSTIFWWNILVSSLIYIILYLSAPAIANFYHTPLLSSVLRVLGVILIINSLNIVQTNQLRKQLNFKRLANVTITSNIIASFVAIFLALKGYGVWTLVFQQIITSSIISLILWHINNWKPKLCFSKESFRRLFNFGSFILISNLLNTFCNNIQGLLIGRFFTPATMGFYTQAHKLESIASHTFTIVVEQVSYPLLSKLQSDKMAMKNVLNKVVPALIYISLPLMFLLILLAEPLIIILYGNKWLSSIPFFQILCIAGMSATFHGVHYYAIASLGKSRELFIWTIIKRSLGLIAILMGMHLWGIYGLTWGVTISAWIIAFINAYLVSKSIGYTLYQQLKDLFPIITISTLIFIIIYGMNIIIATNLYIKLFTIIILYSFLYVGLSSLFKIKSFIAIKNIITDYKNKRH